MWKDQQMELFFIFIRIPVYSYQSEKYLIQSYTNAYNQCVQTYVMPVDETGFLSMPDKLIKTCSWWDFLLLLAISYITVKSLILCPWWCTSDAIQALSLSACNHDLWHTQSFLEKWSQWKHMQYLKCLLICILVQVIHTVMRNKQQLYIYTYYS